MVKITKNPRRLRSMLTWITALVLSPLTVYQIYKQFWYSYTEHYQGGEIQYFMSNFYMAYAVADTIVGNIYYPQYFPLLEGWVHHIGSILSVVYYVVVKPEKISLVSMGYIIEIPTILLCLGKIFYDVPWVLKIKKYLFFPMFVTFRIVLPICIAILFNRLYDWFSYVVFFSMTLLNCYWLLLLYDMSY